MKSRKLTFLFAAAMMLALTYVPSASAGGKTIWENPENPCNKVSLSGSIRYRYEQDSVTVNGTPADYSGTNDTDRDRQRIRVRLGFKIQTGGGVTGVVRLTTDGGKDSQNETLEGLEGANASNRYDLNVDRGYVTWKHGSGISLTGGKFGNPAKQLSGAWYNGNNSVEGMAVGFGAPVGDGKIKLVVAKIIINEENFDADDDDTALQAGLHWSGNVGDIKLDVAFTNLSFDYTEAAAGTDTAYNLMLVGAKMGPFKGGIEYFNSDVDTDCSGCESSDKSGMVIHVRYKINDMLGIRVYHYDMGDFSQPLPQTDFAEKANFTGQRIQLDVKAAGMTMDFRYLTQKIKNDNAAFSPSYMGNDGEDTVTRIQANFIVGF